MSSLVILKKDENELDDVNRRLAQDGMRSDLSFEHKLRYIWRLFERAETSLQSAVNDIVHLKRQQSKDTIEVENYICHIRHLSEQQKSILTEYEKENEELKQKLHKIQIDRESYDSNVKDMSLFLDMSSVPKDVATKPTVEIVEYLVGENQELDKKYRDILAIKHEFDVVIEEKRNLKTSLSKVNFFETDSDQSCLEIVENLVHKHQELLEKKSDLGMACKNQEQQIKVLENSFISIEEKQVKLYEELFEIKEILTNEMPAHTKELSSINMVKQLIEERKVLQIEYTRLSGQFEKLREEVEKIETKSSATTAILANIEHIITASSLPSAGEALKESTNVEDRIHYILQQNKELEENLSSKMTEYENLKHSFIENNKNDKRDIEHANKVLEEKLKVLKENEYLNKNKMDELEKKIFSAETACSLSHEKNKTCEEQIKTLTIKNLELDQLLKDICNKNEFDLKNLAKSYEDELNLTIQHHQTEQSEMLEERQRYNKHIRDIKQLREKVIYIEKDNKLLKEELEEQVATYSNLKTILVNVQDESEKKVCTMKEQHCDVINSLNNEWRLKLKNISEEYQIRLEQYEELKIKSKTAVEKSRSLKRTVSSSSSELKSLKEKQESLMEEKIRSDIALDNEKDVSKKYKKQFESIAIYNENLKSKLTSIEKKLKHQLECTEILTSRLREFEKDLKNKTSQICTMEEDHLKKVQDLEKAITDRSDTIYELRMEIETILGKSKSEMENIKRSVHKESRKSECEELQAKRIQTQNSELKKTLKDVIQELNGL